MFRSFQSFIIATCVLLLPSVVVAGPIYVYTEPDGVTHFSSSKPPAGSRAKVFTASRSGFSYYGTSRAGSRGKLFLKKYSNIIDGAAVRYSLGGDLLRAVIHAESSFDASAVSKKGAKGLMQLMDENSRIYGVSDPFSPAENVRAGAKLLARLRKKYSGNLELALAAYNAGEGAVKTYEGIPPYPETQEYVKKVLRLMRRYRAALYE